MRFTEEIMERPSSCSDVNSIENQRSILKMKLYEGGKQIKNRAGLSEAIKNIFLEKLTKSMDNKKNEQNQWIIDYWLYVSNNEIEL